MGRSTMDCPMEVWRSRSRTTRRENQGSLASPSCDVGAILEIARNMPRTKACIRNAGMRDRS